MEFGKIKESFIVDENDGTHSSLAYRVSTLENAGYVTTDTNTTYSLTGSGSTITLTGSDGSTSSRTIDGGKSLIKVETCQTDRTNSYDTLRSTPPTNFTTLIVLVSGQIYYSGNNACLVSLNRSILKTELANANSDSWTNFYYSGQYISSGTGAINTEYLHLGVKLSNGVYYFHASTRSVSSSIQGTGTFLYY